MSVACDAPTACNECCTSRVLFQLRGSELLWCTFAHSHMAKPCRNLALDNVIVRVADKTLTLPRICAEEC